MTQELSRHATMAMVGLYGQAFSDAARRAQGKIVEMVRNAPLLEQPQAQEAASSA